MRFYYFPIAPNPTRVRVYLNEKGLSDIEQVLVDLTKGEHRSEAHLARNPAGTLPVLELDDGSFLTESLTIMNYLEERFPDPPMLGTDLESRARAAQAERAIEMSVLLRVVRLVHAVNSPLGLPPNPAIESVERERLPTGLSRVDQQLADKPFGSFVMGETPTLADCTLYAALQFAEFGGESLLDPYPHLARWYGQFKQRPSAAH